MPNPKITIALQSLVAHGPNRPVPIIGANNRIIEYARYDEKANRHVARLPYEVWEREGEGIVKAGTNPMTQWFPKVELAEVTQSQPAAPTDAEKAGQAVAPTHAPILDKLPEEVTPGHLTLPANADKTHLLEEPPLPGDQLNNPNDQRIQLVQTVVAPTGDERPSERISADAPQLQEQPSPDDQRNNTEEPRIQAVQEVVQSAGETAPTLAEPGEEDKQAQAQVAKAKDEEKKTETPEDQPADAGAEDDPNEQGGEQDLEQYKGNFRKLRSIAKAEGVPDLGGIKTSEDMIAAIKLHREEQAKNAGQ